MAALTRLRLGSSLNVAAPPKLVGPSVITDWAPPPRPTPVWTPAARLVLYLWSTAAKLSAPKGSRAGWSDLAWFLSYTSSAAAAAAPAAAAAAAEPSLAWASPTVSTIGPTSAAAGMALLPCSEVTAVRLIERFCPRTPSESPYVLVEATCIRCSRGGRGGA